MKDDFSASASGKTPFDQIAALEEQEQARVQTELDAMQAEEQQVKQALQEKEGQADAEMKEAAKKELFQFRETDVASTVKAAEADGQKEASNLETQYTNKEKELVNELVESFLAYNPQKPA